jgi:hypothetical protein
MVAAGLLKTGEEVEPGVTLSISNCKALETTPPDVDVCTVIGMMPALEASEAGTCATSWLPLTNCVTSAVFPQKTTESPENPAPFTVRPKPWLPALENAGDRLVRACCEPGMLIVYEALEIGDAAEPSAMAIALMVSVDVTAIGPL